MQHNPLRVLVAGLFILAILFGSVIALTGCGSAAAGQLISTTARAVTTTDDPCAVELGTFDITATGFSDDPAPSGTVSYKYFPCANMAMLFLPGLAGNSNANTFTAGPLPSFLIPATITIQEHALNGYDNGVEQVPMAAHLQAGSSDIVYSFNGNFEGWTPSGTKGIGLQVITVFLD